MSSMFRRAFLPWLVQMILLPSLATAAAAATSDTCETFGTTGTCATSASFITSTVTDAVGALVSSSADVTAESIYDQFIEPMLQIAAVLPADEEDDFCFGDFDGSDFDSHTTLDDLGCDELPFVSGTTFGALAAAFDISPAVQAGLVSSGLWTTATTETVMPGFCMGMRIPSDTCHKLTFGITANAGAIAAMKEVTSPGGAGGAVLKVLSSLESLGLNEITLAASYGGGLDVETKYYSARHFGTENFDAHLYCSHTGAIDIPNVGSDVVSVDGAYHRAFNFGPDSTTVEATFGTMSNQLSSATTDAEVVTGMNTFLSNHPEVIKAEKIEVNLDSVTQGYFSGFKLDSAEIAALKLPTNVGSVPAGFSFHAKVETDELKKVAETICTDMEGIMILVSGGGCPSLDTSESEGTIGFEIRKVFMELTVQWTDFFLRCRIQNMDKPDDQHLPKVHCQIDSVAFAIFEETNGYTVGKSVNFANEMAEVVTKLSKSAVAAAGGKFRKTVSVSSKLSSLVAVDAAKSVGVYFGGADPVTYGFVQKQKCHSTRRLFDSRNPSLNADHFAQLGQDDSMASCFEACYQDSLAKHDPSNVCCEYQTSHDGYNDCRVGYSGGTSCSDDKKWATVNLKTDYENMVTADQLGESCSVDKDCATGTCHGGHCRMDCQGDHKCFPSSHALCYGQDDACINMNGREHKCGQNSHSCECAGTPEQCAAHHFREVHDALKLTGTVDDREASS